MVSELTTASLRGAQRAFEDQLSLWGILRRLLLFAVLFKYSGIRDWPHAYAGEIYEPSRAIYYLEAGVSVAALAVAILHYKLLLWIALRQKILVLFVLFAIGHTLARSPSLAEVLYSLQYLDALITIGLLFYREREDALIAILTWFGLIFALLNILSLAMPTRSVMIAEHAGLFRGLTAHKNDLSQVSVFFFFITLFCRHAVQPAPRMIAALTNLTLIALAGSASGFMLLAAGLIMKFVLESPIASRNRTATIASLALIGILAMLIITSNLLENLLLAVGRDATLTGRDRIWELSLSIANQRPIWGWGLGKFSSDLLPTDVLLEYGLGTLFGSAHSSYIESVVALGYVGSVPFFLLVLTALRSVLNLLLQQRSRAGTLSIVLLMSCLLGGISASEKMFLPTFGWLTFVVGYILADKSSMRLRA